MTTLPQGALDLLDHDIARRLLTSAELARPASVARDGTPRALPTMFHGTGREVIMATFAGAANVAALDHPGVRMVRIALRPARTGVLDFRTRFPGAMPVPS